MAHAARLTPGADAPPSPADVQASFRSLYDAHFAFVWRTLLHFGVPSAVAEDAAQEVFVILHRRLSDYDGATQLRSWLWGMCRRVAQTQHRRHTRDDRRAQVAGSPSPALAPDDALERSRAVSFIQEFLAGLPEELRDVFVMMEIEAMSASEVADALEVKLNTVYSRLRLCRVHLERARQRMRAREARVG